MKKYFAIAALITLLQIASAVLMTPADDNPHLTYWSVQYYWKWASIPPDYRGWYGRYRRLNEFDSIHYLSIAENGYIQSSPTPTRMSIYSYQDNEGFFPGYPYTARLISFLGVPADIALLLVAQFFAFVSWLYLLLILKRNRIQLGSTVMIVSGLIAFPSTLFLVTGYAESTFIANLLGMIYWYGEAKRPGTNRKSALLGMGLSAFHGMWMSATRLVGLPLAAYPVLVEAARAAQREKPDWLSGFFVAAVTSLGGLLYFAYLNTSFGRWDYYFFIQRTGWFVSTRLKSIFDPSAYFQDVFGFNFVHVVDVTIVLGTSVYLLFLIVRLFRQKVLLRFAPLLYICLALFFIPFTAMESRQMEGMLRYVLPSLFLVAVIVAENREPTPPAQSRWPVLLVILSLWVQYVLMSAFLHGNWVA